MNYLFVGLGGAIGAFVRFSTFNIFNEYFSPSTITLIINCLGSFILGYLFYTVQKKSNPLYLFVTTGMLSGFTTFSTFSSDVVKFLQSGSYIHAVIIVVFSLLGCVLFASIGAIVAKVGYSK